MCRTKNKKTLLYTYRYLWKVEDDEKLYVDFVTGDENKHAKFVDSIRSQSNVTHFVRVYVNTIELELVEKYENLIPVEKEEK